MKPTTHHMLHVWKGLKNKVSNHEGNLGYQIFVVQKNPALSDFSHSHCAFTAATTDVYKPPNQNTAWNDRKHWLMPHCNHPKTYIAHFMQVPHCYMYKKALAGHSLLLLYFAKPVMMQLWTCLCLHPFLKSYFHCWWLMFVARLAYL